MGKIIVIEGTDSSGKETQTKDGLTLVAGNNSKMVCKPPTLAS